MIYIWVRETTDWDDEEAFRAQLSPKLLQKVDLWDRTFNIPFHTFRHRVSEIAKVNHSRVEGAVRTTWDEIPEGGLVLPVDDDDWFSPHIVEVIARELALDAHPTGCYWISSFIQVPIHLRHRLGLIRRRVDRNAPPKWVCTTNNYAMVKIDETRPLLESHVAASRWVERSGAQGMRWIDRRLSVMNRTLASQTSLAHEKPSVSRRRLVRRFRQYKRLYEEIAEPELHWYLPYMRMMAMLMDDLELT